jgi:hypothetical protein
VSQHIFEGRKCLANELSFFFLSRLDMEETQKEVIKASKTPMRSKRMSRSCSIIFSSLKH